LLKSATGQAGNTAEKQCFPGLFLFLYKYVYAACCQKRICAEAEMRNNGTGLTQGVCVNLAVINIIVD
jgi:hypothetical protein